MESGSINEHFIGSIVEHIEQIDYIKTQMIAAMSLKSVKNHISVKRNIHIEK
jgi:hypothetical protein